ncbi:MAG: helix-turn-helix transcriptional regulator [Lentisphaeria bacterium]
MEDFSGPEVAILGQLRQLLLVVDMGQVLNISAGHIPAKALRLSHVHELFEIRILFAGTGLCQESYSELRELRLTPPGLIHSGLNQNEIANHITIRFDIDSLYYVRGFRILDAPLCHELEPYGINLNNLLMTLNSFCSGLLVDREHLRCALAHFISALMLYMRDCKIQIHDQLVSKICSYIHENYHRGDLTIAEIAGKVGISANYIQKVFRKSQQCTPKEYLVNYRLHTAQRLLRQHRYRIKEVAMLSGWNCPHYFANAYQQKFGHYPSEES